MMYDVKRTLNR